MKKHVPFLLSLLSIMGLLAWTAAVRAQCSTEMVLLDVPVDGTATDESDYQHTVTVYGGASYALGYDNTANGAIHFNGASQVATIPYDQAFQTMNEGFTLAAWVRPTSFLNYNTVVSKLNGSHRDVVLRYHDDGKLQVHWTNSNNTISATTTDNAVLGLNSWKHVAATWDGTTMRLFVNGQMVKEATPSEGPDIQTAGNIQIGMMTGSERIVGYADQIEIRGYAVRNDEVSCLMYGSTSAGNDIVMHLPLDGDGTDVSANTNNGSVVGGIPSNDRWLVANSAMTFSSNSRVNVSNISAYNSLGNAFTISAWINPSSLGGIQCIVSKTGSGRDIVLRMQNDGKLSAHYFVGGYVWCSAPEATINSNEWSHVACTWDGSTMKIYHNGEILQSVDPTTSPSFTTANWSIGALTTSGQEGFDGVIDEVKVWSRALNVCELRSDIHNNLNLLVEDNLIMCPGQSQLIEPIGGLCSVLWTNDNSTEFFYDIDADDLGVGDHQIVLEAYDYYDNFYSDTVNVTVSLCTGIEESVKAEIMNIYPNPASNVVTIKANELAQIELLDISGRVLQQAAVLNRNSFDLNISSIPSGVYFVRATVEDGNVLSERLIKH